MGVDYTTYIGPYVEVHNPPIPAKESYTTCPNKKCKLHKRHADGKFCGTCGSEIKELEFETLAPIHVDQDEFDDKLVPICTEYKPDNKRDYDFWVDNLQGRAGVSNDSEWTYVEEIYSERIMQEVQKLGSRREKEINRLKEIFGDAAVVINWGVVAYAH